MTQFDLVIRAGDANVADAKDALKVARSKMKDTAAGPLKAYQSAKGAVKALKAARDEAAERHRQGAGGRWEVKWTVRAWVALHRECGEAYEIDLTSEYYGTFVIGRARQQVTGEGARVVRCTITYDDGLPRPTRKPARKAK